MNFISVVIFVIVQFQLELLNADETCSGLLTLRQNPCPQIVLRLPSDGSGVYHLILNASMPIYSNENLHVELENEQFVKSGTAEFLVYVVSHPSCDGFLRITQLRLNGQLLCVNEPYKANTKQAATKFSYTGTHYGIKNIKSPFVPTTSYNPINLQDNNFLPQRHNSQNNGNHLQNPILSNPYPSNPFLASLGAPKVNTTGNKDIYPNNPFLNGQFSISRFGQTPSNNIPRDQSQVNKVCGYSTYALIKGGSQVQPGEFPWLGGLFQFNFEDLQLLYQCTVNLVSEKHVITAAHCIENKNNPESYMILFGHHRDDSERNYTRVREIKIHPEFQKQNSTTHDVAVLTLNRIVTFTLTLKPICLWQPVETPPRNGMVAGFGPDYSKVRKIALPIVTQEECRGSHAYFHYVTSEYTFCAGLKNNTGPCLGDSGAGFMQWLNDRYYLRGLVSHSLSHNGDCNLRQYIIFADLSKEISWLKRTIV